VLSSPTGPPNILSSMSTVAELKARVAELEKELNSLNKDSAAKRDKIEKMSAEVVDSNPYSRLMALQRMGIVSEYERIRHKSVAVVGESSINPKNS
jgi:ubiquitin-like modifier-activating enzyme 5